MEVRHRAAAHILALMGCSLKRLLVCRATVFIAVLLLLVDPASAQTEQTPSTTQDAAAQDCCVAPEEVDGWLEPLRAVGPMHPVSIVREPDGTPVAWCAGAVRSG